MKNFIAKNATIVGDVTLDTEVTVWFNSVLRGGMGLRPYYYR
ncbi:LpxA family protein [Tetragenococcus muriaticus PMC-11-5]|uniref:LpxA family protein n=2 Tax=Tetragenococcus muriaticus TaxID=64642 RepID=A0A091C1D4_9ENTE|nr:LpxA family protein [Tetragenococcus muriaticus 3MR10-3]KFN92307.1 LpxA family protein [Tetragenococcus muriaticus PMC-11-5]GMA46574.1 hypothetical protein GCM10025854_08240 [Tetragenococcus muriaticus]